MKTINKHLEKWDVPQDNPKRIRRTRKQATVEKMRKAVKMLNDCLIIINKENQNGKQFDFVSDASLANVTDRINALAKAINNVVYQEN